MTVKSVLMRTQNLSSCHKKHASKAFFNSKNNLEILVIYC